MNNHTTTRAHRSSEAKVAGVAMVSRQSNGYGCTIFRKRIHTGVNHLELAIAAAGSNANT